MKYQTPSRDDLLRLLLSFAEERTLDGLLGRIVTSLSDEHDVALARIWLLQSDCRLCGAQDERALHLVASAGRPRGDADWSRVHGDFHRVRVGERKIGEVGTGRVVWVEDVDADAGWIADPEWARAEGIRGFGGAPLRFGVDVLGVLGVFTRAPFGATAVEWLRVLADHAAAAIANTRANDEVDRLRSRLEAENAYLREEVATAADVGAMLGESPAMQAVRERIGWVAPTDARVLITGESGTGKELVAREIHRRSARADGPLIAVNCAAIPRELVESEFFGHTRGAFSGAVRAREGRFQAADGGTLFLDEVGELPLELQAKLLRVLEDGTYQRLGEDRTRRVDVRVLAATNQDLAAAVRAGRFREDLYYRLNVFPLEIPPLRDRRDDIEPLALHFLRRTRPLGRGLPPRFSESARRAMHSHAWPGNARELRNAVERAVITWTGGPIDFAAPSSAPTALPPDAPRVLTRSEWFALERRNLRAALEQCDWRVGGPNGAAALLETNANTLRSRIARLGIERPPSA